MDYIDRSSDAEDERTHFSLLSQVYCGINSNSALPPSHLERRTCVILQVGMWVSVMEKPVSSHLTVLLNNSQFSIWRHRQKVEVNSLDWDLVLHPSQADDLPRLARSEMALCVFKTNLVCKESEKKPKTPKPDFYRNSGWTSLCLWQQTVFWTVSLHIPPVCQHVYTVSWSMLAVALTCVSNGRDVSSEGQPNEGNGRYQNRGLLVAQQEVWARRGSYSLMLDSCSGLFGGCQQHPNCFQAETAAVDLMGWTDGGHIICGEAWAVTDKALRPLIYSVNTEQQASSEAVQDTKVGFCTNVYLFILKLYLCIFLVLFTD